MSDTIYQFKVQTPAGKEISLEQYKGKVLLIVNTASACGFTPQLKDLETIYTKYKDKGFEILAFPCDDFGNQEPLNGNDIADFCSIKYCTTFPVFNKVKVKGTQAHPLFQYLRDKSLNGSIQSKPRWNFHKVLVDRNGKPITDFPSFISPTSWWLSYYLKRALR